jgi:hypothetical protein
MITLSSFAKGEATMRLCWIGESAFPHLALSVSRSLGAALSVEASSFGEILPNQGKLLDKLRRLRTAGDQAT